MIIVKTLYTKYIDSDKKEVSIYDGAFSISDGEEKIIMTGKIYLSFGNKSVIVAEGEGKKDYLNWIQKNQLFLNVPGFEQTLCYINKISYKDDSCFVKARVLSELKSQSKEQFDSCILHVANLFKFQGNALGEIITEKKTTNHRHAEVIEDNEWFITIQPRYDYKDKKIFEELSNTKGYEVTHLIEIKRKDRKLFDLKQVEIIQDRLKNLLSFCTGRHIGMPIMLGKQKGKTIIEKFSSPVISPYKGNNNWYPMHEGSTISSLYRSLTQISINEFHYEAFEKIVHWYVSSETENRLENGMINAQIALEQISFFLLTQAGSPSIITEKRFDKNSMRKNLEKILFHTCFSSELQQKERKDIFENGPAAITEYRNHIAHPKPDEKFEEIEAVERVYIKELAVYYIEVLTLYLLDYKGKFTNRRKFPSYEGTYEKMPEQANKNIVKENK